MKFLWVEKISDDKAKVVGVHYRPEELPPVMLETGILVEEVLDISQYEQKVGKSTVHYINPQTKEQWVEYEDRELTNEEKLQQKIELLEGAVMELTMALALALAGQGGND